MTFIHDNVAIVGNDVVHDLFAVQALNHGNVNNAAGTSRSAPDLANRFDRQIQKCREPLAASGVSKKSRRARRVQNATVPARLDY